MVILRSICWKSKHKTMEYYMLQFLAFNTCKSQHTNEIM